MKNLDLIPQTNIYLGCSKFNKINPDHDRWIEEALAALEENDSVGVVHLPWDWQYKDILVVNEDEMDMPIYEWAQETYENDIHAMSRSDVGVFLIDVDNIDTGVIFEIGWLTAYNKPVIAVFLSSGDTLDQTFEGNLMLTQSIKAFFKQDIQALRDYNFNHCPGNLFTDMGKNFEII